MLLAKMYKDFHEVPEHLIKSAAELIGGNNAFTQLLVSANLFRHANVEPIFMVNTDETVMFVTSRETFTTRLH